MNNNIKYDRTMKFKSFQIIADIMGSNGFDYIKTRSKFVMLEQDKETAINNFKAEQEKRNYCYLDKIISIKELKLK